MSIELRSFRPTNVVSALYARFALFAVTVGITLSVFVAFSRGSSSSCSNLIPKDGAYDVLRIQNSQEFHETLEDYLFKKNYGTHDEAIKDGFSVGFPVYGEPLKAGNDFSKADKEQWYEEYKKKTHLQVDSKAAAAFEQLVLNPQVIKSISACIVQTEGFGVLANLESTGDCTATFTARYIPQRDDEHPPKVASRILSVQGGECDPWPTGVIGFASTFVNCRRNARDALTVTINTKGAGGKSDEISALTPVGPEPTEHDEYGQTFSKPETQDLTLFYADFPLTMPKTDLQDYRFLQNHDIASPSGGPIQNIEVLKCDNCGAHFWLCDGLCNHSLFEPVSPSVWRMYVYSNSSLPPPTVGVRVHYLEKQKTCTANCGADVLHANWVAENSRTCPPAVQPPQPNSHTVWWIIGLIVVIVIAVIAFLLLR